MPQDTYEPYYFTQLTDFKIETIYDIFGILVYLEEVLFGPKRLQLYTNIFIAATLLCHPFTII